jgi:response regulator RpfG family c-di-GMP phosphodiesterase/tRNA A-37 threonylcarbamoyl transferase component Bud32
MRMGVLTSNKLTQFTPMPAGGDPSRWTLNALFSANLVLVDDWERLPRATQEEMSRWTDRDYFFERLVELGLLTSYQAGRLQAGRDFGLVLGNYRVLDRLGAGGMGVVYRAEHVLLRRPAAIKVLSLSADHDTRLLLRFRAEMRAVGALRHPNIVAPLDAGQANSTQPGEPVLHYLIMEFVDGPDLDHLITSRGPLPVGRACEIAHQIASALAAAHARGLVHRDIKPTNILVAEGFQAKLLDFGLAQDVRQRLTEPGVLLGTLEYMAPEQAQDAHMADIRADLYGLGGVLYWCLAGQPPFPGLGPAPMEIARRLTQPPPSVRTLRPEVPAALDQIISRLMAPKPDDRFPDPQAVVRAMIPFRGVSGDTVVDLPLEVPSHKADQPPARVLIVDDEPGLRRLCRQSLSDPDVELDEASTGTAALEAATESPYDLVLLDVRLPDLSGFEVLRRLREIPGGQHLRVLLLSGAASADDLAKALAAGADDYLCKPFTAAQLNGRVRAALRLKTMLDKAAELQRHLQTVSNDLAKALNDRDGDLAQARSALVLALATAVGQRSTETEGHLRRVQLYVKILAGEARRLKSFDSQIDADFIRDLECCAPLHDVGTVALPDHILHKPGRLDPEERMLMQSHTQLGAELLEKVLDKYGAGVRFLTTAAALARHHHERWDGEGYPDKLAADTIPLAARLFSLCDVYDALRSRRAHRPGLAHSAAVQVIVSQSPGQFDPRLLDVFKQVAQQFETIYRKYPD